MNEKTSFNVAEPGINRVPENQGGLFEDLPGVGDGDGAEKRGGVSRQREWQLANPEASQAHEALHMAIGEAAGAGAYP